MSDTDQGTIVDPESNQGRLPLSYEEAEARILSLTKTQRSALDRLATGGNAGVNPQTLAKLELLGLIVREERNGRDALGKFTWREYHVPVPVHYVVTQMLSDEFDALSPEEKAAMEAPE